MIRTRDGRSVGYLIPQKNPISGHRKSRDPKKVKVAEKDLNDFLTPKKRKKNNLHFRNIFNFYKTYTQNYII